MHILIWGIIAAFFGISSAGAQPGRVTLNAGDIFIGTSLEFIEGRHQYERFKHKNTIPYWFIKSIEPGVDTLELTSVKIGDETVEKLGVYGEVVSVTSHEPAEISHLEFYPPRAHFWVEGDRFLRGYIVNRTMAGYSRMSVRFIFYGVPRDVPLKAPIAAPQRNAPPPAVAANQPKQTRIRLTEVEDEIFDVFPMTMKPFIIDTTHVPWGQVDAIEAKEFSSVEMKPDIR